MLNCYMRLHTYNQTIDIRHKVYIKIMTIHMHNAKLSRVFKHLSFQAYRMVDNDNKAFPILKKVYQHFDLKFKIFIT